MRLKLGLTQEGLAREMGVSLPTVGRWESWKSPQGISLARILCFAESRGREEAAYFRLAIESTDIESAYVEALLLILREDMYEYLRPELRILLDPAVKAIAARKEEGRGRPRPATADCPSSV